MTVISVTQLLSHVTTRLYQPLIAMCLRCVAVELLFQRLYLRIFDGDVVFQHRHVLPQYAAGASLNVCVDAPESKCSIHEAALCVADRIGVLIEGCLESIVVQF